MDNIIEKQLIVESVNQNVLKLNEIDFGGKIRTFFNNLSPNDKKRLNLPLTKFISEHFDGDFGKYLNKYLNKNFGRKVEFVKMLVDYREEGKTSLNDMIDKNHIFNMIGNAAIDYIEKKVIHKFRLMSVSGNRSIDRAYRNHILSLFELESVQRTIFVKISNTLDKKIVRYYRFT